MKFSAMGMELLKKSEGFRSRVYQDVAGVPTIGYGHRLLHADSFPNGIDEPQASNLLSCDVRDAEQAVQRLVRVPLTQGQYDALVDFCFNLGAGRLANSTLLKSLNAGRYDDAANEILQWNHAGGKECAALKTRREAEAELWRNSPVEQQIAA
jgi:lysozyme